MVEKYFDQQYRKTSFHLFISFKSLQTPASDFNAYTHYDSLLKLLFI